ncbi:uncharacterized protein LOC108103486 [Drosophila eugracilis]|uniref:uncharacterized protein LOC108103486 n=1 Tax=Drosophila eugracilis TaxID=29029 RepID=UPI0007E611A1|nr:uncharacterized protein LOC108103486 [Drosophila eugracilis]
MSPMNLIFIYLSMLLLAFWQVEGRRLSKRLSYYNYDDEADSFEKQSDFHLQSIAPSEEEQDNMHGVLHPDDMVFGYNNNHFSRKKHRSQVKPARKYPDVWSMPANEKQKDGKLSKKYDFDLKMLDEEDEQH